MSDLAALRLRLVASREDLHEDEAALVILEARAEQEIIDALPGETPEAREKALGPNVEARKRRLAMALGAHKDYQDLLRAIRGERSLIDHFEAKIDNLLEDRRERELVARERLIDVLAAAYGVTFPPLAHDMDAVLESEAAELAVDGLPGVPGDDESRDIDDGLNPAFTHAYWSTDQGIAMKKACEERFDALCDDYGDDGRDDFSGVVPNWRGAPI